MAKSFLGANTDSQDVFLLGNENLFVNKRATKMANQFVRREDITSNNDAQWGSTMIFEPQQIADYLGKVDLVNDTGTVAVSDATGGSNYPRFVDWVGYLQIKQIRVTHSSNQLQKFSGLDLYINDLVRLRSEDTFATQVDGGLEAAPATRYANAIASSHEIITPLSLLFWCYRPATYLPYNIEVLRRPLTINVELKPILDIIQTDGSATPVAPINSLKLRCQMIHLNEESRSKMYAETESFNDSLKITGWARLVSIVDDNPDLALAAQAGEQTVKLTNLRLPTQEILYTLRDPAILPTGSHKTDTREVAFEDIASYRVRAYNENLHPKYTSKYGQMIMNEYHSGPSDANVFSTPLGYIPESTDQFGYLNFNSVSNPELVIETGDSAHTNLHLSVRTHAVVALTGGDLRMIYA